MQAVVALHSGEVRRLRRRVRGCRVVSALPTASLFERTTLRAQHDNGDAVARLPKHFRAVAHLRDGTIVTVEHAHRPLFGVQFHPEADCSGVLTRFVRLCTGHGI